LASELSWAALSPLSALAAEFETVVPVWSNRAGRF